MLQLALVLQYQRTSTAETQERVPKGCAALPRVFRIFAGRWDPETTVTALN